MQENGFLGRGLSLTSLKKGRINFLLKESLQTSGDGHFKVVQKINDNVYRLELRIEYGVSPAFNVCDLIPFLGVVDYEEVVDMRINPF